MWGVRIHASETADQAEPSALAAQQQRHDQDLQYLARGRPQLGQQSYCSSLSSRNLTSFQEKEGFAGMDMEI